MFSFSKVTLGEVFLHCCEKTGQTTKNDSIIVEKSHTDPLICTVSKYGNVHGQLRQSLTARDFHPVIKNNLYLNLCWFV